MTQRSTTSVRLIEAGNYADWRRMFDAYLVFYETELPDDLIQLTWKRLLEQQDGMFALIAQNNSGQAVGIANLVCHRSTWAKDWYCYLEDLYVDPAIRGTGAGRALIEATYAEAAHRGASRTYWATHKDNEVARRLYDRMATLTPFLRYER